MPMTAIAMRNADWLMRLLSLQSREVRQSILEYLSISLKKEKPTKKPDMSFFDGLSNAWDDEPSPEEEIASIRKARTSGETRNIIDF